MSLAGFSASNHPQQIEKRGAVDEVDDRGTEPAFIASLEARFGKFTLDVAAADHNAKAQNYYTRDDDGLANEWSGRVWCNPPYSDCGAWVRKAWQEWDGCPCGKRPCTENEHLFWPRGHRPELIVMLLPANRVEQGWWQDHVEPFRDRRDDSPLTVEFLRGRMRFDRPGWTKPTKGDQPPFGCCLLIWGDPA